VEERCAAPPHDHPDRGVSDGRGVVLVSAISRAARAGIGDELGLGHRIPRDRQWWAGLGWHNCAVAKPTPKAVWTQWFPVGEPAKESLGRLIEQDHHDAEIAYYEAVADPTFVQTERDRRRYRGMLRRRLRRR
jgi:hypothetical protein